LAIFLFRFLPNLSKFACEAEKKNISKHEKNLKQIAIYGWVHE